MPKPGPKKNNAASKTAGAKGGKSRPSLKRGRRKQDARTGQPKRP
jgi:hypothetical protein